MTNFMQAQVWYDTARKFLTLGVASVFPVTLFINAPFGRFTSKTDSVFLVDGIKSWIVMELVSPLLFSYMLVHQPLSALPTPAPLATKALAAAFLAHYLNRALISPLRTPSRSKSHIIVPMFAVVFNTLNGSLMGTYLSTAFAKSYASNNSPLRFYGGLLLWALGFAGNIIHDEILLNIRRKAKAKGKAKEKSGDKQQKEHYAIPHGLLYKFISYPNYFCEWVEWLGFALAAAPIPVISLASLVDIMAILKSPSSAFSPTLTPPWIFFLAEILTMLPRAIQGHKWYHEKFPEYPKERKAVIPFIL